MFLAGGKAFFDITFFYIPFKFALFKFKTQLRVHFEICVSKNMQIHAEIYRDVCGNLFARERKRERFAVDIQIVKFNERVRLLYIKFRIIHALNKAELRETHREIVYSLLP